LKDEEGSDVDTTEEEDTTVLTDHVSFSDLNTVNTFILYNSCKNCFHVPRLEFINDKTTNSSFSR
jgi:hypothetical protein